ncbi:hypothetical protein TNCV_3452521 [Trichonephila clavipes]|nr:hypothetical protein TNCV_3452521 [Trichonephila clavipes]
MVTRLRTPFTDQLSRTPSHHTTHTRRANCLIGRFTNTCSAFIMCAANHTQSLTPRFGAVLRTTGMDRSRQEPGRLRR